MNTRENSFVQLRLSFATDGLHNGKVLLRPLSSTGCLSLQKSRCTTCPKSLAHLITVLGMRLTEIEPHTHAVDVAVVAVETLPTLAKPKLMFAEV
eukprot:742797-Amphidinium_carterae.1